MSKNTPIDVIKGISGKYGGNSNDYFATNKSSNKTSQSLFRPVIIIYFPLRVFLRLGSIATSAIG